MMRNNWWKYIGILAIGSIACYHLTISLMPNVIYAGAKKKILSRPGYAVNKLSVSPIVDATSRAVVMPNPDFIYLTSFYDLSDGPLRLSGNMPDSTYWSVAMYHPNTVNWFVKNDMEFEEDKNGPNIVGRKKSELDLDLTVRQGSKYASHYNPEGDLICDNEKGFLLIRVLITDRSVESVKAYQEILDQVKLEAI